MWSFWKPKYFCSNTYHSLVMHRTTVEGHDYIHEQNKSTKPEDRVARHLLKRERVDACMALWWKAQLDGRAENICSANDRHAKTASTVVNFTVTILRGRLLNGESRRLLQGQSWAAATPPSTARSSWWRMEELGLYIVAVILVLDGPGVYIWV